MNLRKHKLPPRPWSTKELSDTNTISIQDSNDKCVICCGYQGKEARELLLFRLDLICGGMNLLAAERMMDEEAPDGK